MSNTVTDRWAIIRQVVIGAADLEATSKELREGLGLAPGFPDPMLEQVGLVDDTLRVGPEAHLEVVAPLNETASMNAWISKGGGGGGYALAIQVPDLAIHLAAAEAQGVRIVADLEAYGRRIVQLHPKDMGVLVELDEVPEPEKWFWDDIETETPEAPLVDDVLSVDVQSPAPLEQAERWAAVFGVPLEEGDTPRIKLGNRAINFVQGERRMFSAIDLQRVSGVDAPDTMTVGGVLLRLR